MLSIQVLSKNMDRTELCKKLKTARMQANLKQEAVAKTLQIPTSAISAMEAGVRKLDVLELQVLANLYSKQIQWFFEHENIENKIISNTEDKLLTEAYNMARQANPKLQKAVSCAIIGFLKESE